MTRSTASGRLTKGGRCSTHKPAAWRWVASGRDSTTLRSVDITRLGTPPSTVVGFVTDFLLRDATGFFRDKSDQRRFQDLETLVEPLGFVARPGDRLLLSPSGIMGRLPCMPCT